MPEKTLEDLHLRKTWNKTGILLVLAFLSAVFLSAPAEASGVPSKIITFTDKKVYTAWIVDSPGQSSGPMNFVAYDADFGDIYVYAVVLDDDGKLMKGRSITGRLNDTVEYDHDEKANATYHNNILADPNLYDRTLLFNDTGANGDGVAGDGIYTAKTTLSSSSLGLSSGNTREENHIKLRMYANDTAGGLSENTEVLISYLQCMNGAGNNRHGGTHIGGGTGVDNCAVCHVGYEHFFENKSGTFADNQLDIHALKWNPPDVTPTDTCGKGFESWVWNRSWLDATGGASCTENWEAQVPGSKYCFWCHTNGTALYDYGVTNSGTATTRNDLNDKPSCNRATCHASTDIEAATVLPWTQAGAVLGAGQNNYNIWKQKAHNHTTTPTANASCALCHLSQHSITRPNPSTTNVTLICQTCHNRTDGWLNVSKNQSHPVSTACKNCHLDNNKLDAHTVPTGTFGGRWCLDCHKINGKAPIFIDDAVVNVSNPNYIHYKLNNKSDATNSSRICWACHTNNSVVQNNIVNSSQIPLSSHPANFTTPRKCLDCHNNSAGINFSAPQPQRHTWWASTMKTSAVTYCTNCHSQSESLLSYNQSATTSKNDNTSVSHYGKNRTDLTVLIGQKAYCATCHQNETTVYGPFAKEDNKVRSDHASQITTPSCSNSTCHRSGNLHDSNIVKPNFTESNISQTCYNCHNSSNYKYHNNTLTCWDCHLNGTAGNIHPIQFVQYNGNFTGAKLTGATCYDCHKTTNLDNTTQRLAGTTPPKIYSQSHSNDPINGTKWGDYWKYTPTTYQFASYEILGGNGSVDPAHPFSNIEGPSNDYMQLNETQTGRGYQDIFPIGQDDREFINSKGNWTGVVVSGSIINGNYDAAVGNPAGSIYVDRASASTVEEYNWTSGQFYYNGSADAGYTYANFSMEKKITASEDGMITTVVLIRPVSGNVTIYSATYSTTDASFVKVENTDISSYLTDNGNYSIRIYTKVDHVSGGNTAAKIYYDNVKIMIKEKVWNRYEMVVNTTGVPVNGSSVLGMAYQVHKENTSLKIYNKTSQAYELLDTLDKGVFYDYTKSINSTYHINSTNGITGNVSVKFVDDNQNDTDSTTDTMHIRYLYVYTDRGLQYPCEQCHSPNKHYINPTLGSPSKFNASNKVNQTINSSSTWCQQCHWQGAANYSKMIQEFNLTRNPPENVPPEITGNATYAPVGGARDGTPYKNHTGFDLTDSGCFACHGGSLNQNAGMTAFVHGVSEGVSGGSNCTNCHNVGQTPPKAGALVNISAMNDSNAIHKNLNSGATTSLPAANKKCWACHGNGSEPAASDHPTSYKTPYKCVDCHVTRQNLNYTPNNTLLNVTQHYWNGTNISTGATSCYSCHNRSEMMVGLALDPDGVDTGVYNGDNGGNGSSSHYGKKRADMAGWDNTTYCNYCHNTTTNNATFYVSNFNNTIFNHSARASTPLCTTCHNTGRIHNSTLAKPVSNDTYCSTCHGTSGTAVTKNKTQHKALYCTECHANNTVGTLAGKDIHAVKYLTQGNTYSTSNSSAVNCVTCHQTATVDSSLTGFTPFKIQTPMRHSDNASNGSVWGSYWTNTTPQTACIYCHSNTTHNATPLGRILQWSQNYQMYGGIGANVSCSDCHYKGDSNYSQMNSTFVSAGLATPPEITNGTSWKGFSSNYYNHSLPAYDDTTCKSCHGALLSASANMSEFMHNAAIGVNGGANCTACHNIGGSAGAGKLVNFSAINDSNALHKNLNSGATNSSNATAENKKCWACHGNGSEPGDHPSNYKTPYNCTSCHISGAGQNLNFTPQSILNVTQHYWNGTSVSTANATSCYICHNKSEMMVGLALDPDGAGTGVYSGANGGNNSASHYGKKRNDMAIMANLTYCNYCHNNASSVFPFANATNNRTIANHSVNYASSNPECRECHEAGRLHNSTLYKPAFALPNSSYCLTCHGTGGSATIKNLERHNSTSPTALNCTQCHLNSTKSIHPARYLQQNSSWSASKTNAVNCTTCHQSPGIGGFNAAPMTPKPMNHSTNTYSGALWNNTQPRYWDNTSQQSSCDYCHGKIALHNNSGLGNITKVKGSNAVRQALANSTWCANCHYAGATSGYAGTLFSPEPPEITNATGKVPAKARDNTNFYNHSQDMATGYNDSKCKNCHDNALDAGATSLNFSHNLAPGGGGANCTSCHYTGASVQNINITALNDANAIHKDLNKNAVTSDNGFNDSKKCWACHSNGQEPSGHPTRYRTPYNCTDCHVQGGGQNFNYTPNNTILNVTQHYWNGNSVRTPNATSCYACHNTSGMITPAYDPDGASNNVYNGANGGNLSVSHYGIKRNDMAIQQNTTPYCDNCHNGASAFPFIDSANRTIANHSANYPATNPTCKDCHSGGRIHNSTLYKTTLTLPNATYCTNCHGIGGSASIKNLERHNNTGTSCTQCHLNASDSIHPVRYLQQDTTWATTKAGAVNCTSCHQGSGLSGFGSAPRVPLLNHSTNTYSGALWNGTQQKFWENTSQQSSCNYCHGNSALHNLSGLGNITRMKGNNTVRQGFTGGYWCANCHYNTTPQGNYSYKGNLFDPEPPEVLNKSGKVPATARDSTQFYNHSNDIASSYDDAKCKTCHDNALGAGATSLNFTHSLSFSSGGANCTNCHGLSGNLADGKRINHTAMNSSLGIHKDLNKDSSTSDANYSESKKCWACHGNGQEPTKHPDNYKTPYNCVDCHTQAAGQNFNYTPNNTVLNVTQHYWNGTSIGTANATSCYICHNKSEMMAGLTLDPDGASSNIYSGANGGNLSVSHYGKKRSDMAAMANLTYCNYCHNNQSGVFPFINATNNKTIANHSLNYAATNPSCSDCHASGRLHNSTLYKPSFDMSNVTYCLSCHGNNGSGGTNYTGAVTGYREKHNNSLCTGCHINSTRSIHPVRYLQQNNTWGNTNNSAVNCTSCHQGAGMPGFSAAFIVETPVLHSNNTYSGAMWNGTQPRYWDNTSQLSSCYYCHGKASLHNASRLGNSGLVQGGNSLNQSLTGGYWCANCHYNGSTPSGNYNYKGYLLNPIPPEVFNLTGLVPANASDGTPFQNHSTNIAGDWSDARCKTCHGKELPSNTTSATFLHKLNQSQPDAGGPDCLNCHASTAPTGSDKPPLNRRINASAFTNYSVHKDLNKNAINSTPLSDNRSKACWACHSDGTQPVKHPANYLNPKPCEYCHVNNNFNATLVYKHYPGAVFAGSRVYDNSDPNRTCVSCHNNSVVANLNLTYGTYEAIKIKNATASHYAVNRTLGENLEPTGAVTEALPNTRNTTGSYGCNQCHAVGGSGGIYGSKYGNAKGIPSNHNSMGAAAVSCQKACHNSNPGFNITLHAPVMGINVGTSACYSSGCHTAPSTGGRTRR